MTGTPKSQRRTLLKAAGALTGLGVLGRLTVAQDGNNDAQTTYQTETVETSNPDGTDTTNGSGGNRRQRNKRTIVLGARVGHWLGLAPRAIEGQQNPTLGFIPTERYKVIWVNLDGKEHEFQILGQDDGEGGQVLYRTGSSSEQGAVRTLTFKPTDRIRRYRCRYHPETMRGDINRTGRLGGGGTYTTGTSGGRNTNRGTYTTGGTYDGGTYTTGTSGGRNTNRGTYTTGGTYDGGTYDTRTTGTYGTRTTETSRR